MQPTPVLAAAEAGRSLSQLASTPTAQDAAVATPQPAPAQATPSSGDGAQEQYLVVLSGLIGSGKSTFARALCEHYPEWRRCNQDELGDRHAVVDAARTALLAGHNVVVDRTNIDARQRRTWLELARDISAPRSDSNDPAVRGGGASTPARRVITVSLTLTISTLVAEERLRARTGHETIKTPQEALGILPHFLRMYQKATVEEGFHYVLTFPAAKMSREPSVDEVRAILLDRLQSEVRGDGVLPERPPARSGGGGGRGRGRGRGRGASAVYTPHLQHQPHPTTPRVQPPAAALDTSANAEQGAPSFAAAASLPPLAPQAELNSQQPQA
ncbi:hypothetical protein EX895_003278 [Sporisorium graminicola]|uniref:tRNA ligase kinase domain-containing protein n=1 Tax=Sporisorium graminicola TaxID=280036 RepID=A0A4U7KUC7_9BASI|nr:hypothetical protein EX895_003278 [Sporisorium graminicola]TKY87697.1 hypothetical protein EX895_003278 [Sporisorium graminicola]